LKEAQEYTGSFFTPSQEGLRNVVIDFFEQVRGEFDVLAKVDNDCMVPKGWLNHALWIFENYDVDILSPNVTPSHAAEKYGKDVGLPYLISDIVGGLWIMRASMLNGMEFVRHEVDGLTGAFPLIKQIIIEQDANVGWMKDIIFEDMGHWSGEHPEHIKSKEHEKYSYEVGREIAWTS